MKCVGCFLSFRTPVALCWVLFVVCISSKKKTFGFSRCARCKVSDNGGWASELAESLRAELAAVDAVKAGEGPWLTVTASYAHQAGALSRYPHIREASGVTFSKGEGVGV